MAALNLSATMQAIADEILAAGITKRAYAWPAESISAPAAIVGYPDEIEFDVTFGRGSDRAVFPVWFVVGKASERTARDEISKYITGVKGIKDALDGDLGGAVQTCRVTDCEIMRFPIGDVEYLAAKFTLETYS